jgi:hypothetical protein
MRRCRVSGILHVAVTVSEPINNESLTRRFRNSLQQDDLEAML